MARCAGGNAVNIRRVRMIAMDLLTKRSLSEVAELCTKHSVRRLALFGSAASDQFDPSSSDVDLLVEFEPMPPVQHADSYFGLQEDLQRLLGLPVDLVEPGPIRNPYFRQAIEQRQVVLYEAA
jgi:predicted nucleotidyltransferase